MDESPAKWHARFQQQAEWTASLRRYAFARLQMNGEAQVLEVGCGTGAISSTLHDYAQGKVFGLDINLDSLRFAHQHDPSTSYCGGNALDLPFQTGTFEAVVCHFLLLWVKRPEQVLREMTRVCRVGGTVMALAEPDYGGRIDFPPGLAPIGQMQAAALQEQGADVMAGRKLTGWMHAAGLSAIETGVLGGQWTQPPPYEAWLSEWDTLESDLSGRLPPARMAELKRLDQAAWENGSRVLFIPTFYGIGIKV